MMANLARESGAIPKCLKIKLVKNTISDEFRCGGYGKVCTAKLKSNSELVAVKKVAIHRDHVTIKGSSKEIIHWVSEKNISGHS